MFTSVTVVLWKISWLYTHPVSQLERALSFFPETTVHESACPGRREMLRFTVERLATVRDQSSILEPRQWWGGVAPVKTLAIMWNARKICGRHIHTYKSFWYLPKPPIVASSWSKFIPDLGKISLEGNEPSHPHQNTVTKCTDQNEFKRLWNQQN